METVSTDNQRQREDTAQDTVAAAERGKVLKDKQVQLRASESVQEDRGADSIC